MRRQPSHISVYLGRNKSYENYSENFKRTNRKKNTVQKLRNEHKLRKSFN